MDKENLVNVARDFINKDKWWETLSRFIEVLRINIFIVDIEGLVILPPENDKFGANLLTNEKYDFSSNGAYAFIKKLESQGAFLEYSNELNLKCFAIPIEVQKDVVIAYAVLGPVILNKKPDLFQCEDFSKKKNINSSELLSEINELRVVSNLMVNSILELFSEIIKDNVERSLRQKVVFSNKNSSKKMVETVGKMVQEIYATVRMDELLVTLLDVALKITNTEHGSIMIFDENENKFIMKVSRGLNAEFIKSSEAKFDKSIASMAIKENRYFIIDNQKCSNYQKVEKILERPEIKQSLVMPLANKNKVLGVLNLNTSSDDGRIKENIDNIERLTKLLSVTI